MTSGIGCGIITRSPQERWLEWSLKIEQQERSTKHIKVCATDLEQFKREYYSNKSKIAKSKSSIVDWIGSFIRSYRFNTMISRVWSWLRMNAGGVHNTFKSNGRGGFGPRVSGGRVSNAWATCPCVRNNVWKRTLIPHNAFRSHGLNAKDLLHRDGLASD